MFLKRQTDNNKTNQEEIKHKILKWNLNLKKIIQWSWIQLRLIKKLSSLHYEVTATITMLISEKFKTTVQEQTGNFNRFLHKVAESDKEYSIRSLNKITIWTSNPTSGYIFKGNEIRISKRYLDSHVHYSIIHNNKDMEPLDEGETGEWKRWLKTQHSEN